MGIDHLAEPARSTLREVCIEIINAASRNAEGTVLNCREYKLPYGAVVLADRACFVIHEAIKPGVRDRDSNAVKLSLLTNQLIQPIMR